MAFWTPPPDWPIAEPGLLMAAVDDVMFVHSDERLTEAGFQRHLKALAEAIDGRREGTLIGVVYDAATSLSADAKRRQAAARMLDERRAKLKRTTAAFALATPSPLVRGALHAVFWLAPPPYPWYVVANVHAALAVLKKHMPNLEVDSVEARWEALKAEHIRR
ncbi:MAG TPA: hypothetical protein VLM85_04330 [Polyangiaceae bacterium]|nr:hypothetical protein [Polyangiaceae bacterium]